jgi:hypothetical protein
VPDVLQEYKRQEREREGKGGRDGENERARWWEEGRERGAAAGGGGGGACYATLPVGSAHGKVGGAGAKGGAVRRRLQVGVLVRGCEIEGGGAGEREGRRAAGRKTGREREREA